ncbi:MAG: PIN domain-containing protein [Candidatus Nanopelagicales bacterium]
MPFVDTNVVLYAVSTHPSEVSKAQIARTLLESADICLSTQVLQEFYVQATRQSRPDALSRDQAAALVEALTRFSVQDVTVSIVRAAIHTMSRFNLSYWDAAIIEAARELGCAQLLSEDLSHGQDYNGVTVVNPFL